jgi:hypothetical protein
MLPICVAANQRTLELADGTPFFWLGDTGWELFRRLDLEDAEHYLSTRAAQGFNVIQAMLISEFESHKEGTVNVFGEHSLHDWNPERPNEAYFTHVDKLLDLAERCGLYVCAVPVWGDKVGPQLHSPGPEVFNPQNAAIYGRFLGERYKSRSNLIWMIGGDRTPNQGWQLETWRALAEAIRATGANQLMTYHPQGNTSSSWFVHAEEWLQLNSIQSGHAERHNPSCHYYISVDRARLPIKPVLNSEPCYEDHPVNWNRANGTFLEDEVRFAAYQSVFSGACGHTYGHYSVFMFHEKERPGVWADPQMLDWRESLHRPGAGQVGLLRNLIDEYGLLEPVPQLLHIAPPNSRAAVAGETVLIYLPQAGEIALNVNTSSAHWFNPKDGSRHPAQKPFIPPFEGDWVLICPHPSSVFI